MLLNLTLPASVSNSTCFPAPISLQRRFLPFFHHAICTHRWPLSEIALFVRSNLFFHCLVSPLFPHFHFFFLPVSLNKKSFSPFHSLCCSTWPRDMLFHLALNSFLILCCSSVLLSYSLIYDAQPLHRRA